MFNGGGSVKAPETYGWCKSFDGITGGRVLREGCRRWIIMRWGSGSGTDAIALKILEWGAFVDPILGRMSSTLIAAASARFLRRSACDSLSSASGSRVIGDGGGGGGRGSKDTGIGGSVEDISRNSTGLSSTWSLSSIFLRLLLLISDTSHDERELSSNR